MKKRCLLLLLFLLFPGALAQDLNVSLAIEGDFIYKETNTFSFYVEPDESGYVEFEFKHQINNSADILKEYSGNYNLTYHRTLTYQWTPDFEVYNENNITPVSVCGYIVSSTANDQNSTNDFICKYVNVIGGYGLTEEAKEESDIKIDKIYDEDILKFGQSVLVKINIKRGDTSKYSVNAYVESEDGIRVSEETKFYVLEKNEEYTFKIPVFVKSDCSGKYGNGTYYLFVEGLGERDREIIEINGNALGTCNVEYITVKQNCSETVCPELLENVQEVFSSDTLGSLQYAQYIFMFTLILLILGLTKFRK